MDHTSNHENTALRHRHCLARPRCPFTSLTRTPTHHPPPGMNRGPCLQPKLIQALSAPSWTSPILPPPRNLELELSDLQVTENEDCRHSGKESTCQCRRSKRYMGSIPGSGRFLGEGNGNSLQYSCLENLVDRGAWQATVHGGAKSRTQLSVHVCTHTHTHTHTHTEWPYLTKCSPKQKRMSAETERREHREAKTIFHAERDRQTCCIRTALSLFLF